MSDLIYPTLDLFLYTLKSPLNATEEEIQKNKATFLAQLPPDTQFNDADIEIEYLELTYPPQIDLQPTKEILEGYYYTVRINDTYGLQIDCSFKNQLEAQSAKYFEILKAEITQKLNSPLSTIGQTWMLSGWLPGNSPRNPEDIAKDCYCALFTGSWQPNRGRFLDATVFELSQTDNFNQSIVNVNNHINHNAHHVIIAIYPNRDSAEKAAEFYSDWMGLFCYRSKITWAYWQSRLAKESLVNHFHKVDKNRQVINQKHDSQEKQNIANSQTILNNIDNILQKYTIDLLNLSFQKQTIEINLANYQIRLALIKEKAGKNNQLDFLEKFSNLAQKKYLPQITKDIENMQLGLQLLEDTINATRSRIEVEKLERDRNFQELVAVAGAGIVTVSLIKDTAKDCKDIFQQVQFFCKYPLSASLMLGIIVSFVVWWLRKRWRY
ncbi:hypothetical protein I8748_22305 [Nostoc sp. CENA67]|uniref:Uncharacterized protein n=1 Tax=Amazonocrinis nigriterrae CENA67 TaxID=2794033 RepID=A0A8J7HS28_9NOST|nr:hypothetical protein [Amazonocrinis nigriterrae]MBH8564881.1 hypothetical protein [Amazonocrinis nigriterrae CENA67]